MKWKWTQRVGAIVALSAVTGCASVPRDSGFSDVQKKVSAATNQQIGWDPAARIASPANDDAIRPLLAEPLSADRAVAIALRNNRDLLATIEELGIARADYIAASTIRNPLFDAEIRFPAAPVRPFELALTQTVFDLLQFRTRRQAGTALFTAARARVAAAIINFAAQVRTDYFDLQAAQQLLARQQVISEASRISAELAQRQHTAGSISDLDLENEQAMYEQAKLDLARAELETIEMRERLIADLGILDRRTEMKLPEQFAPLPAAEPATDEVEARAVAQRFDISVAQQELAAARNQMRIARVAPFDELAVGIHHDREPEGKKTTGPSLAIPIPLFNRGAAQRTRALAMYRSAQQRLAAMEVNARSEIRAARERMLEARARYEYTRDVVLPRRQRILYLTQLEYNAMLRGVYQLIQARQNLASAEREAVLAQRDYWVAQTELETATRGVARFSVSSETPRTERLDLFRPMTQQQTKVNE